MFKFDECRIYGILLIFFNSFSRCSNLRDAVENKKSLPPGCYSNSSPVGGDNVTASGPTQARIKGRRGRSKPILQFGRLARMFLQICEKCEVNRLADTLSTTATTTCISWRNIALCWMQTERRQGLLPFLFVLVVIVASASVS